MKNCDTLNYVSPRSIVLPEKLNSQYFGFTTVFTKSPPLVLSKVQTNPFNALQSYLRSILISSAHLCLGLSSRSTPFSFLHQNPLCIYVLPHEFHWPFHLTLLDFITLVIFREDCISFDTMHSTWIARAKCSTTGQC